MDVTTAVFISYAANTIAQYLDGDLTQLALHNGFTEANPVTRFLFKHLGLGVTSFIKFGALPFIGLIVDMLKHLSFGFNAVMAAVTVPVVIWNIVQLKRKKIKISLF